MRHTYLTSVNFLKKSPLKRVSGRRNFFVAIYDLHQAPVDFFAYHVIIIKTFWSAFSILTVHSVSVTRTLVYAFLTFAKRVVQGSFGILAICFGVCIRLPFLLVLFLFRVASERSEDFFDLVRDALRNANTQISKRVFVRTHRVNRTLRASLTARRRSLFSTRSYHLPRNWHIQAASFALVLFFLAGPFVVFGSLDALRDVKEETVNAVTSGFAEFLDATQNLQNRDHKKAQEGFEKSKKYFNNADTTLRRIGEHIFFLSQFIPGKGRLIRDSKDIIEAGESLANAGSDLAALAGLINNPASWKEDAITDTLSRFTALLSTASINLESGYHHLVRVDADSIPQEQRAQFIEGKMIVSRLYETFRTLGPVSDLLDPLLGVTHDRRYLVILQNTSELRATGGFMGTYALVDIKKGGLKNLEIPGGGTYDLQGQLRKIVASPWPLRIINPRWEFQDANWFPDFPTSARKIVWFYEHAGGPTVDGVITINASLGEKLLALTGPIELPSYKKTVTAENFFDTTQRAVELEYDRKKNTPKKFLGDLLEHMITKIQDQSSDAHANLFPLILDSLVNRDIQIYFSNPKEQAVLTSLGLANEIRPSSGDYLMIVDTNIGGGKTDRVIDTDVAYRRVGRADGAQDVTVTIRKTHNGAKRDFFTGRKNVDYVRIYVPDGSTLLSAKGFLSPPRNEFENPPLDAREDEDLARISGPFTVDEKSGTIQYHESGKGVFGNWIQTAVGETSVVEISYRLPFFQGMRNPDTLTIQRQSGSTIRSITAEYDAYLKDPVVKIINPFIHDERIQFPL